MTGRVPCQFGPTRRKLLGAVPVLRLPTEAKTSVHLFMTENETLGRPARFAFGTQKTIELMSYHLGPLKPEPCSSPGGSADIPSHDARRDVRVAAAVRVVIRVLSAGAIVTRSGRDRQSRARLSSAK